MKTYRKKGRGAGRVVLMITEWDNGWFDAELYPHCGTVIAETQSLDSLFQRLQSKSALAELKKVGMK